MLTAKRPRALTDHRPGPARIAHQLARLPEPTRTPRPRSALRDPLRVNHPAIGVPAAGLGCALKSALPVNNPAIGVPAAGLGCALKSALPVNNPAIGVPAAGLGCALKSALPVNNPAIGVPAAGLGCALKSAPRIRDRAAPRDPATIRGPDRGLRRRTPAHRLGLRAGCSPNTHHRRQHGATPRRAPFRRHSSPQTPHHIPVHSQIDTVAASEAPHCSLVPSLTYRTLPSTSPTYQPLPFGPSLDKRAASSRATALISVRA